MNKFVLSLFRLLASWTVGAGLFNAAIKAVQDWEDDHVTRLKLAITEDEKKATGDITKSRVINELKLAGYSLTASTANFVVEFALQFVKRLAG